MPKTLLLSGFDLRPTELPPDTQLLSPPMSLPGLEDFQQAASYALEEPLAGEPLARLVGPLSKVAIVIDDLTFPVPMMANDCRKPMLQAVLQLLRSLGVKGSNTHVRIANGLNRQWRPAELEEVLGPSTGNPIACHDAEDGQAHVRLDEAEEGPIEIARSVVDADLVIHLNVVTMPLGAGLHNLVSGTASYRTARLLSAPHLFEESTPLAPGSALHAAHQRVGEKLAKRTRVFQLSVVLNNELWDSRWSSLLRWDGQLTRPTQVWNAMPEAVRHRAARMMKASFRPIAVMAGPAEAVARRALEIFSRQHEVEVPQPSDIVLFGLPDIGPYSIGAMQNPILAAHLALGLVSNLVTHRPMLKQGGVLIFANPLTPTFDRRVHLPYQEFYERVLRLEREPPEIHQRFEPYFAGRPEFVANYQRRFSFHGTHPLHVWYQCTPARRRAGKIIVAHGDPRACARLGFMPAADISDALRKAHEFLAQPAPSIIALELPPPFFLRVR